MKIKLSELHDAYLYASGEDIGFAMRAWVNKQTGQFYYYSSEMPDNEPEPDDFESGDYVEIPGKRELDLGTDLVFEFMEEKMPDDYDTVSDFFRKKGAYRRFKDFLEHKGRIDDWYAYEQNAEETALREWCEEHGIELDA